MESSSSANNKPSQSAVLGVFGRFFEPSVNKSTTSYKVNTATPVITTISFNAYHLFIC